jgi:hypothetical protein
VSLHSLCTFLHPHVLYWQICQKICLLLPYTWYFQKNKRNKDKKKLSSVYRRNFSHVIATVEKRQTGVVEAVNLLIRNSLPFFYITNLQNVCKKFKTRTARVRHFCFCRSIIFGRIYCFCLFLIIIVVRGLIFNPG